MEQQDSSASTPKKGSETPLKHTPLHSVKAPSLATDTQNNFNGLVMCDQPTCTNTAAHTNLHTLGSVGTYVHLNSLAYKQLPILTLRVQNTDIPFMVDSGATHYN